MLLHRILHYGNHYDVQTAAMLACIFHVKSNENQKRKANEAGLGGNISVSLNSLATLLLFLFNFSLEIQIKSVINIIISFFST